MNRLHLHLLSGCNDTLAYLRRRRHRLAVGLFLALGLDLLMAPALYAASGTLTRGHAYALGLLGLVVVGLAIYLATVILTPEKF